MSKKAFIILTSLLAILILFAAYNNKKHSSLTQAPKQKLLLFDIKKVKSLNISFKGNNNFIFSKTDNKWICNSKHNYPANRRKINEVIIKLAELESSQNITSNPENHERLNLDEKNADKILLQNEKNEVIAGIRLGKKRESQKLKYNDESGQYVLPASGNTVYLIPDPFDISKNIKDWLHSSILEVLKSDIQKIQFFQTSPKLSIINKEKGKEIFECNGLKDGDTAKSWVIDQIASMFEQFELKDIHLAASEQFKNKEFIQNIKVHTFPGLIYEIALMEENDSAYIKIQCFSDKTEINDIAEDKNKTFSKWIYEIEPWVASNIKKKYEDIAETPEITSTNNQQSTEIKENPDISPDEQPEEPKIG